MTMGQRILAARQEAGLSQRELAGGEITRNMLSALEHDRAQPSLATLKCLSQRLGKPVGYFLGEAESSDALEAFTQGQFRRCRELLSHGPERQWLEPLALLREAEAAIGEGRLPYARELLGKLEEVLAQAPCFVPELQRSLRILKAKCPESPGALPGLAAAIPEDDALLLRAQGALADGRPDDAERYLLALDDRRARWHHLMGESCFQRGQYRRAAEHYHRCEEVLDVRSRLEICYRELEDYKMAYYYAKQ